MRWAFANRRSRTWLSRLPAAKRSPARLPPPWTVLRRIRPDNPMLSASSKFAAVLVVALCALARSPAAAHYSESCVVRFTVSYPSPAPGDIYHRGYSPPLTAHCNYLTGEELNARAADDLFAKRRVYVVIVWPRTGPSYIRLTQPLPLCGEVTEPGCADRISGKLFGHDHGYDLRGRAFRRTWEICQPGVVGRDCHATFRSWRH